MIILIQVMMMMMMMMMILTVTGALRTIHKGLVKGLEALERRWEVETIQTTD